MSGILDPDALPYTDRQGNEIYTDFKNMIRIERAFDDEEMTERQKVYCALRLLYGDNIPDVKTALGELMWFYHRGMADEAATAKISKNAPRLYDFEEDADYIYSAFLSCYGIDLIATELHWWQFMALFLALPENTQMAKRMYYRGVDTSKLKGSMKTEYEERKKSVALRRKNNSRLRNMTREELEQATKARVAKRFEEAERLVRQQSRKDDEHGL